MTQEKPKTVHVIHESPISGDTYAAAIAGRQLKMSGRPNKYAAPEITSEDGQVLVIRTSIGRNAEDVLRKIPNLVVLSHGMDRTEIQNAIGDIETIRLPEKETLKTVEEVTQQVRQKLGLEEPTPTASQ
ncbi:MAG: hypothetical protein V1679_00950 [Candidatus Peregrinibacteria bacterium]